MPCSLLELGDQLHRNSTLELQQWIPIHESLLDLRSGDEELPVFVPQQQDPPNQLLLLQAWHRRTNIVDLVLSLRDMTLVRACLQFCPLPETLQATADVQDWPTQCAFVERMPHLWVSFIQHGLSCVHDDWIRPVAVYLLPHVADSNELWLWAWDLWAETQSLLATTTLLCALNVWDESDNRLWDLIYTCLSQGLDFAPSTPRASLLRKRGLFLLSRTSQRKTYAACLETLEMESQGHLIAQVWPTVAQLRDDWKWLRLLWARALVGTEPVVRKLVLYHVLTGQAGIAIQPDQEGYPLERLPVEFLWSIVVPAFDTLESTVGVRLHLGQGRGTVQENTQEHLVAFLERYSVHHPTELIRGLWDSSVLRSIHGHTVIRLLGGVVSQPIDLDLEFLQAMTEGVRYLSTANSVVPKYRQFLFQHIATLLSRSRICGVLAPKAILDLLSHFPLPKSSGAPWVDGPLYSDLRAWTATVSDQSPDWVRNTCGALATAFVDGLIVSSEWETFVGATLAEREAGQAIVLLAALSCHNGEISASELLWPAIHKGISIADASTAATDWLKADHVARACVLLEFGCLLQVVSGMGNGDLVVDKASKQMMAPPPNVEAILSSAVAFSMRHIDALIGSEFEEFSNRNKGNSRSGASKILSGTFGRLIDALSAWNKGFPSSIAIGAAVDALIDRAMSSIVKTKKSDLHDSVTPVALLFGALSCGGSIKESNLLKLSSKLLGLAYKKQLPVGVDAQPARSIFHFAKWGALSCIVPILMESGSVDAEERDEFVEELVEEAIDAVDSASSEVLVPLFRCMVDATKHSHIVKSGNALSKSDSKRFASIVDALSSIIEENSNGEDSMVMLDELCSLLFSPNVMLDEALRYQANKKTQTPVLATYRRLLNESLGQRPHMSKVVLCRAAAGWLGDTSDPSNVVGKAAVLYCDDILRLLLHKEDRMEDCAVNHSLETFTSVPEGAVGLPEGVDVQSIARFFALVFMSRLPSVEDGLDPDVLDGLVKPMIRSLCRELKPKDENAVMIGTPLYCLKIRGWQALCIMSRFLTMDTAEDLAPVVFESMGESLHGHVRFFIDIMAIQGCRKFPSVFIPKLVNEIGRSDLSPQNVTSLLSVAGNLIVGRYKDEFSASMGTRRRATMKQVLAKSLPWLSSTQGFSRAIAQLLVHKLAPEFIDDNDEDTCYMRSMYIMLAENAEMNRLRDKQMKFFEEYDADRACTIEGALEFGVDEANEPAPGYVIDTIKECLQEVYREVHPEFVPQWRKMQLLLEGQEPTAEKATGPDSLTFQRKIIPLDALNLALEDMRDQRLRNSAGRRKQPMILCASLVDKVPNLGGLARTSEIFAADRLVIPDKSVIKMDNFTSTSVGAADWLDIEECNEQVGGSCGRPGTFRSSDDSPILPRSVPNVIVDKRNLTNEILSTRADPLSDQDLHFVYRTFPGGCVGAKTKDI